MATLSSRHKILAFSVAALQGADIYLHAATGQLEPLRVTSNLVILFWLAGVLTGKPTLQSATISLGAIGSYVLLNAIFLMLEGLTNAGQPRVALFILVGLTLILSVLVTVLGKQTRQTPSA